MWSIAHGLLKKEKKINQTKVLVTSFDTTENPYMLLDVDKTKWARSQSQKDKRYRTLQYDVSTDPYK